jgi:hypothetical protein
MADHSSNPVFTGPDSAEALLADRQRFWNGFTTSIVVSVIASVVILVGMAVFLL